MSLRFDDVEIDAAAFRVTKAGEPVRLEPKAIELLLFLASRPERLVTKAEIQEAVWKATFVTENALTRLVAQIRKGLGDDARRARYVETVPTRGYRFIAALEPPGGVEAPPPDASPATMGVPRLSAATLRALETQVSSSATLNVFPRLSPDGSVIAFSTLRANSMEIVIRALALGASEMLVTNDGMQNVQPAFSPDGRLLAYHSVTRGGIWLIPTLGGVPRQLTRFGSNPQWSPDGSRIVFQSQSWVGPGPWPSGDGSTLWLVLASGGEPQRLTSIEDIGPGGHGGPAWSPTGRLISFVGGTRVFSIRPDGEGLRQTSSNEIWVWSVVWEKGGHSQLWAGRRDANWFVWRVPVDPDTGEPTAERDALAHGGDDASAWVQSALSPDGRTVTYVTCRTRHDILVQDVTPSGEPNGKPVALVRGVAGWDVPPTFSPEGGRVAFGVDRPGAGQSLWVADLDSREPRLVAEQAGRQFWGLSWFPDGRRLGFVAETATGLSYWSLDLDTGVEREHRRLESHVLPVRWALSPDGTTLIAHGTRGLNLWVMDLAGGPARALTDDSEGIGWPVWSPDGAQLAVELLRGGQSHIGVMAATGSPVRVLTSTAGHSFPGSFSPDGRRFAFAGQRGGIWNVYWIPVDGGEERPFSSYTSPALYVRFPNWSPRGDRIAYEYAESTSTVWVTELSPPERPR